MKFKETPLKGAYIIEQDRHQDERGYFSRIFCQKTFSDKGLMSSVSQTSESFNRVKGTLRGMHFQKPPYAEVKLIRCTQGKLFDVIIDLRENSATYLQSFSVELSVKDNRMLYVPEGFAHGFQTLEDNTVISYCMLAGEYSAEHAGGVRWNDPAFAINWPLTDGLTLCERDSSYSNIVL